MAPYGIVFKEDINLLNESVRVWQKKYGVLKISTLLKASAFFFTLFAVPGLIISIVTSQTDTLIFSFALFAAISVIYSWLVLKKRFIKQITNSNYQNCEKQIVLYGDCLEITTAYGKGRYYYDEIACIHENKGIITVIIDSAAFPYSVCPHGIIKGDYLKFAEILQQRASAKYEYRGGRM